MAFYIWSTAAELRWVCFEKQDGRCYWCGEKCHDNNRHDSNFATLEHLIPVSHGGELSEENCRMACFRCNNLRGNEEAESFRQRQPWLDVNPVRHNGSKLQTRPSRPIQNYPKPLNSTLRKFLKRAIKIREKIEKGESVLSFDEWVETLPPKYRDAVKFGSGV